MNPTRREQLRELRQRLQVSPLLDRKSLADFRVEYGEDVLAQLEELIEDCSNTSNQFIFSGHTGCGKSTLLAELKNRIEGRFFTVFFSIAESLERSSVNHINILFLIAVEMMRRAEEQKIAIAPKQKELFYRWFDKHTQIEEENTSAELSAGFDFLKVLQGKIKSDAAIRDKFETEFRKDFRSLRETINLIATEIKLASKLEVVVIIDDIDKLDLSTVRNIFKDNIKALLQTEFAVLYTIPIATLRDGELRYSIESETENRIVFMPVLKLYDRKSLYQASAEPIEANLKVLREVLQKRDIDNLIEMETLDQLILLSGGVLRELVRLTNECSRLALVKLRSLSEDQWFTVKIDAEILQEALNNLRNDYAITYGTVDYDILKITYEKKEPVDPKQKEFLTLLHNVSVIEYRNADTWYGLHPLVVDLLKLRKVI